MKDAENAISSLKTFYKYSYGAGYPDCVEDAIEALHKQVTEAMTLKRCAAKTIIACPDCEKDLAVAYYYDNGELSGFQCSGDVPPIAKYCKFCGKKFPKNWSE